MNSILGSKSAWFDVPFPKFVVLQRGKDLTKAKFKFGNVPVAGSNGIIGYHNEAFVKAPGVTVGRSGTCGKAYYYSIDFWAHNTVLYVKDFNGNDELFSYYFLKYLDIGRFKTGVSVPTLDRNSLNNLIVSVPPLPEQRKIAHVLSTVQKAIEQQDKLIKTTTELKKALMQKLFTEGTRGEKQKMTEIGLVPESWEVVVFPKFAVLQRGKDLTKSNFRDGDVPVAGSNGIIGFHNESFVQAPGVTIGRSGTCGKPQFYDVPFWAHNTSLYVKDFYGNNELFTFYFFDFLNLSRFKTGVSVPTLDRNSLNTLFIAVPTKGEQKEIALALKKIDYKNLLHQKKKQTLSELFKTLLNELMTGQRRVHEIDFEKITKEYGITGQPLNMVAET